MFDWETLQHFHFIRPWWLLGVLPFALLFTLQLQQRDALGPWKTVISLNYGYALKSDIPDLEGEQEFLLIILKLF